MSGTSVILNDEEKAVFEYLFELQESGQTNMFGAAAYIIRAPQFAALGITKATDLVQKWMNNYDAIKVALAADTIEMKD